jgi:S1-C subfamily serine protease
MAAAYGLVLLCLLQVAPAGIYRYQDAQGVWHFTDDPPPEAVAEPVPGYEQTKKQPDVADLTKQLERGFEAVTPIARATLSVVIIQTSSGDGSGFFCSPDGHILTTRRLIQPSATGELAGPGGRPGDRERVMTDLEGEVTRARRNLDSMRRDLEGYERVINGSGAAAARDWAEENHARLSDEYRMQAAELQEQEEALEALRAALDANGSDSRLDADAEAAIDGFDLILKDGTELTAKLVATSVKHDLALLRLEGVRTPYLPIRPAPSLSNGTRVFAIGNPAGRHETISSGLVTDIDDQMIRTDVPILPGNTGGPLITEQGDVIGISVAGHVPAGASLFSAGHGKAIPIELALEAFPQLEELHRENWP